VLTLVESILEDPDVILRRQLDKVKGPGGRGDDEKCRASNTIRRLEELEKAGIPESRTAISSTPPSTLSPRSIRGVGRGKTSAPKSIAREMFEEFRSFSDYVKVYETPAGPRACSCGIFPTSTKCFAQTVPDAAKNDTIREMGLYLSTMLRQIDSSLLGRGGRKMRDPNYVPRGEAGRKCARPGRRKAARDIHARCENFPPPRSATAFSRFSRALVSGDLETALSIRAACGRPKPWTADRLRRALDDYHVAH